MINVENYREWPIIVIADDLTGANEIGLTLAEHKKKTLVLSEQSGDEDVESLSDRYNGLVVNLGSRHLNGKDAYRRVKDFLSCSEKIRERLFYKKIDSTIRGNLAEEIDAILDLGFVDLVFFVPALPDAQRITVGGYHLVNQVPINKTQYARDVKSMKMSYLPTLLGEKSRYRVDKVPLKVVESGYEEIKKYTEARYKEGAKIMVGDVCMNEDLRNIKDAILNIDLKVLPVGSAGLFQRFFPLDNLFNVYPCLIVCGSLNKVSHIQAKKLVEEYGAKNVELNLPQVFKNKANELRRVIDAGNSILNKGYDLVLSTPRNRYYPGSAVESKGEGYVAAEINQFLSIVVRKIMKRQKLSGLVLTGGSISSSIIHNLKAVGIEIRKQLAPPIPMGILKDGPFDGLSVVTKAGGFGEEDVLIKAVRYLRRESMNGK